MDVKTLCLGVLSEQPRTGYEIKKQFELGFRHFFIAGFGSIYPALAQLASDGLVSVTSVEQSNRPDKKIYQITEAGQEALRAELIATAPRHRIRSEFLVLMYFAHLMPADKVGSAIDGMIEQWETLLLDEIEEFEDEHSCGDPSTMTPGQRFACGYGRTVLTAALAYVKRQKPQLLREIAGGDPEDAPAPQPAPTQMAIAGE
ncbi:MAG: PadR family transcriptional regulator [Pseudomonadota bacterium]